MNKHSNKSSVQLFKERLAERTLKKPFATIADICYATGLDRHYVADLFNKGWLQNKTSFKEKGKAACPKELTTLFLAMLAGTHELCHNKSKAA